MTIVRILSAALFVLVTAPAMAEEKSGGNAPAPDITDLCEKEKVQVCEWQGNQKVCKWVDGDKCAMYMQQPRAGAVLRPGGLKGGVFQRSR